MRATINSCTLNGTVVTVPSKSYSHRALICAALADNVTELDIPLLNADIDATIDCLKEMGAEISKNSGKLILKPICKSPNFAELKCCESGSTLRFLLPIAAAILNRAYFSGTGQLPRRPIAELREVMIKNGAIFDSKALPFSVSGKLKAGVYEIPGNISSQYISGLLMALPLLDGDSEIVLKSPIRAKSYVEMTRDMLAKFRVVSNTTNTGFLVKGNQKYTSPGKIEVEGDWSNAAYFLVAGALGENISVRGLSKNSKQGDRAILDILKQSGAKMSCYEDSILVDSTELKALNVDISDIPDLFPIMAVLAANADGKSILYNASTLRFKESDRIKSTAEMINSLGGTATEKEDSLEIIGTKLRGGNVTSFGDHRIVMSATIAACSCHEPVFIDGAEAVNKSYPSFFEDFSKLGGRVVLE